MVVLGITMCQHLQLLVNDRTFESESVLHSVFTSPFGFTRWIIAIELVGNFDIQIALVSGIWLIFEFSVKCLTLLDSQYITKVEHCLLPMSVLGVGAGREPNGFVTGSKFNVEPCDKSMNEIVALSAETERDSESKFGWRDGIQVESQDWTWICYKCFHFDSINKWFRKRIFFHWRESEAVDVVPD
jgi:hypothetical protein